MQNKLLKTCCEWVLIYIGIIIYATCINMFLAVMTDIYAPHSYIANIKVIGYNKQELLNIIKDFDNLGAEDAIKFSNDGSVFSRPIFIEEKPKLGKLILGITYALPDYAAIYLTPGMDDVTLRETLIHELLHAYFYLHTDDVFDIMYPVSNNFNKEESIIKYSKELKRLYGSG